MGRVFRNGILLCMNKRQAKKWRKKHHYITIKIPLSCFGYSFVDGNMRSYSPGIVEMAFKNNPYKPPSLYFEGEQDG